MVEKGRQEAKALKDGREETERRREEKAEQGEMKKKKNAEPIPNLSGTTEQPSGIEFGGIT